MEHSRLKIVDYSQSRDIEIFVVFGPSDTNSTTREGGILIDVAHQHQVVIERCCVRSVAEMVHEVAGTTLNEPVIIVEYVSGTIVEHAR